MCGRLYIHDPQGAAAYPEDVYTMYLKDKIKLIVCAYMCVCEKEGEKGTHEE